jgi:hypothetical protein
MRWPDGSPNLSLIHFIADSMKACETEGKENMGEPNAEESSEMGAEKPKADPSLRLPQR